MSRDYVFPYPEPPLCSEQYRCVRQGCPAFAEIELRLQKLSKLQSEFSPWAVTDLEAQGDSSVDVFPLVKAAQTLCLLEQIKCFFILLYTANRITWLSISKFSFQL